jgi:hypothetical protein
MNIFKDGKRRCRWVGVRRLDLLWEGNACEAVLLFVEYLLFVTARGGKIGWLGSYLVCKYI